MKIITSFNFKLIFFMLIILLLYLCECSSFNKRHDNPNGEGVFYNRKLKKNPQKNKILTDNALTIVLTTLGYSSETVEQCMTSMKLKNKKQTLGVFARVARNGALDRGDYQILSAFWNCPNINDLINTMNDGSKVTLLRTVVSQFTRQIKKFLRKLRKLK